MTENSRAEPVSSGRLVVRAALRTDVGLVRSENQDFGTYTTASEERSSQTHGRLMIVADGMGGHRGGATASRLAAEVVKSHFLATGTEDIAEALREALFRANARIYSESQANPDLRGMGTTTSALAVRGEQGWFAHVGDSRIYLVRGNEIRQLTDDHSLVASMVREGLLTAKEAESHPRRNVLQRSMGVAEDVEIDVRGPIDVLEGDTFILCSDGLHGLVKEEELIEVAAMPIESAADEYVRRALARGAPDNVTVIVARAERVAADFDETLTETLEQTQPIPPFDDEAFNDTIREVPTREVPAPAEPEVVTDPLPEKEVESPPNGGAGVLAGAASEASPVQPAEESQRLDGDGAPARTPGPPRPDAGNPAVKWLLIVVLVLGAAGAWFFMAR